VQRSAVHVSKATGNCLVGGREGGDGSFGEVMEPLMCTFGRKERKAGGRGVNRAVCGYCGGLECTVRHKAVVGSYSCLEGGRRRKEVVVGGL